MHPLAIIVNNKAKNISALTTYLEELTNHHLTYELFEVTPERLDHTIRQCKKNYPVLLIGGGDGTLRSAAQLCADTNILLAVLPLGTMNHLAKELALPSDPKTLAQAILQRNTVTIDLGEVNDLIFLNNASLGFYPLFTRERDYFNKFYNKWLSYLPGLIQSMKKHDYLSLIIQYKNKHIFINTAFLMISNNLYCYQFPMALKRVSFKQAILGIYYIKQEKLRFFKTLWSVFSRKNHFDIKKSNTPIKVHIHDRKQIIIALDGERKTVNTPLLFKTRPQSLTFIGHSL
ncbi:diacylglycerol/lipid kinase family protein [Legionella oakridgensis]|uniref:Sphingosine kinase and enzymes related to eukaryotic diacylglycerol kinase n=2 Tax=Legionella oakridgensis TaxID=29423 RepID=W0BDU5_9GAMM|nr:diacylglycerol kinase family protein [Legionella oakridgensis]AHE68045.1 sphingosine kinase and enzymes related to eukaryotic diacylglycerol kinase [Legionella oakridgensis ATCC 33761 = DSM 21215]KTD44556.1 Diacylglycerol kinase [Legionella oakridgensis]STY21033.1 Diacylglycerol kinase [Legionella longbeachae]